jgi:hypothetical protein
MPQAGKKRLQQPADSRLVVDNQDTFPTFARNTSIHREPGLLKRPILERSSASRQETERTDQMNFSAAAKSWCKK